MSKRVVPIDRPVLGNLVPIARVLEFECVEVIAVRPFSGCIEHHDAEVRIGIFEFQVLLDFRTRPLLDVASVMGVLRVYVDPSKRSVYVRKDALISIQREPEKVALRCPSFQQRGFELHIVLLRIRVPVITSPMRVFRVATGHTR